MLRICVSIATSASCHLLVRLLKLNNKAAEHMPVLLLSAGLRTHPEAMIGCLCMHAHAHTYMLREILSGCTKQPGIHFLPSPCYFC